jgi:hypothetical protein
MTLYQSTWSVPFRMLCAMRAPRWVVASVTVVMLTMTTAAYGSHGTRRVSDVVADPMDVLYALTWDPGVLNREVWRSTDGGETWRPTALAHPGFIGLAIAPTTPDSTLYVYSDCTGDSNCAGLRKSTDGGATWTAAGFPSARVVGVTIAPDPTTLYAHVDYAGTVGWFKSIDAGGNWTDTNWPPVGQLVIDQASRLYGLNGYDILRLDEGTNNWSVVLTLPQLPFTEDGRYDISAIAPFAAVAGSTVYAINSAYLVPYCDPDFWGYCEWYPEPATVSYSNDGGSTWNVGVLGYYHVWDLAMHGSTLHAATTKPDWFYENTGAIKSTDGGAHWMDTNLNIGSTVLGVDTNAVYAVTSEGLFRRTHDGENWSATALAPHPAAVASFSLDPTSVTVGRSFTATVTLSAAAPAGGAIVTLSSSDPAVVPVPRFLLFSAGSSAATVTVWPNWATFTTVTISATGTTTRLAQVTVSGPATLTSLSFPPSVTGGTTSTGTVTLSSPAPSGGVMVALSSSNTAVVAGPASVTVPAGATTVGFVVTTNAVTTTTTVTISATSGGVTQSAALTVTPVTALVSISLNPTSVRGGSPSTATISLSGAAPSGGVTVTLSSSHQNIVAVPSSITVPAGATSAQFTVSTSRPKSSTDVTISANLAIVTKAAALTVRR